MRTFLSTLLPVIVLAFPVFTHAQVLPMPDVSKLPERIDDSPLNQTNQTNQKLEIKVPVELNYLLYLPQNYKEKESWPLVLFLHGAGERGDNLDLVKVHGPPKLIADGKHFPAIVVSPQCPKDRWWDNFELNALLNSISEKYHVDHSRIYVTGLSMGGYGTWSLAAAYPEKFAAIAPICGGGNPITARFIKSPPIWVFHGAKDTSVPITESERMVEAFKKAGANVKFTVYPEAGHNSWTETYNNEEFWKWLFEQKRELKTQAEK